jgi:hypothetical protein
MLQRSTDASDYENLEKICERYDIQVVSLVFTCHAKKTLGGKWQEEHIHPVYAVMNRYPVFIMRRLFCEVWCQVASRIFFAWWLYALGYVPVSVFSMRTLCAVLVPHLLSASYLPYFHINRYCTSNVYVCYPRSEDPTYLNFLYTALSICSDMLFRQRHVTSEQHFISWIRI